MTLNELQQKIQDYIDHGYYQDVAAAAREAQRATRDYIARTHPKTAFGGKSLGGNQIRMGKYDVHADSILTNVYANYFSRWLGASSVGAVPGEGNMGQAIPLAVIILEAIKLLLKTISGNSWKIICRSISNFKVVRQWLMQKLH